MGRAVWGLQFINHVATSRWCFYERPTTEIGVVLDNEPWLEGREWKIAIRLAVLSSIWLLLVAFLAVFKFSLL
jgi:hypothetical protein